VLPYRLSEEEYYEKYYDDIYYPLPRNVYFKNAIFERNKWIINNSDLLMCYVKNKTGGAYKALRYAEKQNKTIINLAVLK